jgi:hypothetical protein
MIAIKRFHARVLVSVIVLVSCVRLAIAQFWPARNLVGTSAYGTVGDVRRGLRLRSPAVRAPRGGSQHYALEITGVFPYVRVTSLASVSVPVPIETAALSPMTEPFDLYAANALGQFQGANQNTPGTGPGHFMRPACNSCSSCSACSSCTACSSCQACVCGGGSGCSSCSSCSSCFSCFCGFCSSCF